MADGIEQIESRLAAYIDGELADADRAEIEKYLAANPSHRQLIMELKQQRAQIASLPRESAPVEVLDHLQSHLERQALLENVEDGADSMRINRWPQWTAVAAMLLLTVGLGALVFSVLPGGALNHETVAIAPPAVQNLPAAPSLDAKEADEARDAVASAGTRRPDDADTFASKNAGKSAEAEEAARLATRDKLETTLNDAMTLDVPGRPETGGAPATAPGSESVELYNGSAIIVSTDDPLITQNLLAGYLGQNNFEYTPVRAEIAKASVAAAQSASSSNSQVTGEGAANQELSVQVENTSSQQALGSIVARVNAKDSLVTNGEQYLLVRNLSPADAQRHQHATRHSSAGAVLRQPRSVPGVRPTSPAIRRPAAAAAATSAADAADPAARGTCRERSEDRRRASADVEGRVSSDDRSRTCRRRTRRSSQARRTCTCDSATDRGGVARRSRRNAADGRSAAVADGRADRRPERPEARHTGPLAGGDPAEHTARDPAVG
jgi:hypothetical protein